MTTEQAIKLADHTNNTRNIAVVEMVRDIAKPSSGTARAVAASILKSLPESFINWDAVEEAERLQSEFIDEILNY